MPNKFSIKSKLGAEFRRFSLNLGTTSTFKDFKTELEKLHGLFEIPFYISYIDPLHGDLLPINNDVNFALAISLPNLNCLRIHLQTKGESWIQNNGSSKKRNFFENITNNLLQHSGTLDKNRKLHISLPQDDFRQVSSIIDVDIVPETCRRVRLVKHGSDKPLGFYIRDGTSVRVTVKGLEKVPGIFISRLVPGGLAESTGLLAVNDEVLEVNGIEVLGKSLDQVTDMMVCNSANLIITIRPANQRNPFNYQSKIEGHSSQSATSTHNLQSNHNHSGNHKSSITTKRPQMSQSKSENNLSAQHRQTNLSTHLIKHTDHHKQTDLRIPHPVLNNNNENTPPFVKLAPGEDTDSDDDEDEVKEYTDSTRDHNKLNENKNRT